MELISMAISMSMMAVLAIIITIGPVILLSNISKNTRLTKIATESMLKRVEELLYEKQRERRETGNEWKTEL